jgi:hypothetical protein
MFKKKGKDRLGYEGNDTEPTPKKRKRIGDTQC